MGNPFCHIELMTGDVSKAREFYSKLFDWKYQEMAMPEGPYTIIDTGSKEAGGGMMMKPEPGCPTAWMAYVLVADVAATLAKVKGAGGKVCMEKTEIPGVGWFGMIVDPTGANLGVFEANEKHCK